MRKNILSKTIAAFCLMLFFSCGKEKNSVSLQDEKIESLRKDTVNSMPSTARDAKVSDCSIMREGTFTYNDPDGEKVIVKVSGESWTEEHKNGEYITLAKLNWTGECTYENMLVMSSLPGFKLPPGTVMNVTIDEVSGNEVYFTATAAGKSYHNKLTKL